ncbi:MAG TPA: DUF4388 domain-containing protein [Stenomitos sp.]
MAMLGDLSDFSLPDILQMFERAEKTGQLSIWSPLGIYRIWFHQGRIISAIAPDEQHKLKQLLNDHASINPSILTSLSATSPLSEPLGNLLRKRELITPASLAQVFRLQIKAGLYALFALKSGQFRFAANVPLPYEEMTGLSKGALEVAMEGLRQMEVLDQAAQELPQHDSTFIRLATELPLLKLSSLEWSIWDCISPDKSLQKIALQVGADVLEVRKVCLRLMQIGLIEEVTSVTISVEAPTAAPAENLHPQRWSLPSASTHPQADTADLAKTAINPGLLNRLASVLKAIR